MEIVDAGTARHSFSFYDNQLHMRCMDVCVNQLDQLMLRAVELGDLKLQRQIWARIYQKYHVVLENPDQVYRYLCQCHRYLSPELMKEERSRIISRSQAALIAALPDQKRKQYVRNIATVLQQMNLLEAVVSSESFDNQNVDFFDEKDRDYLLREYSGFENELFRERLREGTSGRDGADRVQGHAQWLQHACDSGLPELMALALEYTAIRLKNEAGLHRPMVYQWLLQNAAHIVHLTLKNPASEASLAIAMSDALLMFLCNDMARRDTGHRGIRQVARLNLG
jgi:hypothetical protein